MIRTPDGAQPARRAVARDGRPVTRRRYDPDHPSEPFVNEHGVVIGDHFYDSPNSPLNRWSPDVDPAALSGDEWVHPMNDVGWKAPENQALWEAGRIPGGGPFMHPMEDVSSHAEAKALTPGEEIELTGDFPGKRKMLHRSTADDAEDDPGAWTDEDRA
ncbi:DUF3905 domain-containing protein [Hydrogenibacillus sp. N12]|uniref:DUF3905 domain-containing protein n=1 Tax=Hydrogenibacillus sp. N12 TaxID=2866627 RepID=UPI001C7D3E69|nr:DUF3905 domain-containing protein [Hydrogenibacillus sp. N12]QZA32094.1 DUF3905 domain-containing protein [Hydrogenibacillus sp. N12]